jgi:hypothetical protein
MCEVDPRPNTFCRAHVLGLMSTQHSTAEPMHVPGALYITAPSSIMMEKHIRVKQCWMSSYADFKQWSKVGGWLGR